VWRPLVLGAVVFVAAIVATAWWGIRPVASPSRPPSRITVIVPPGESAAGIARRLAEAGLVRHPWIVVAVARCLGVAGRLRHGEYAIDPSQSAVEIVRMLARGEVVQHRVTVPEGYTVVQIADALAAAGLVDRERFLDLALRGGRRFERPTLAGLSVDSLEGYLFPDTYYFTRGMDEVEVVERFLDRFDARVDAQLREAIRARGLTLHEALTVASMVEREARVPEDRPLIAGVIYNRLARGMRLEIDATVLYALGTHRPVVTYKDLGVPSPYNTYRHAGLPPGPIANPGLEAIRAAAAPASVPYLYYVLRPDGRHHFSRTLREHLDAVRRYRR
jgi:UPF0755 protein